jgi:hypothetical protein
MTSPALPRGIAIYLAVVQFFFALGWTVYVVFLPELLERAGIGRSWTPWILALDQAVFAVADLAMGMAMDRARRALRSVGHWLLGLVALSSLAMLAMPAATELGSAAFLALTLVWVASSAALRAPPFALLGRHAATASIPALAGIVLVGVAAASALAPYLGLQLKGFDPALPFAVASLSILASAGGLVVAERRLAGHSQSPVQSDENPMPFNSTATVGLVAGLLFAVLGFQIQVAINAAEQVARVAGAASLPWLLPVFWGGFAFGFLPAARLGKQLGAARASAAACALGALALMAAAHAGNASVLAVAHALAGAAWAVAIANAFGIAAAYGRCGAEGRYTGILFAAMAVGTLFRIALSLAGVPQAMQSATGWLAVAAWICAAGLLVRADRGAAR